ncbi:MAG: 23S rRNA (guanosine(2251)-2'-O)-methyltransferase RlmB [Patescibacteria group bacterium]
MNNKSSSTKTIFGYHPVISVLSRTPGHVTCVYLQSRKYDDHSEEILQLVQKHNVPIKYLARDRLSEMVYHANHQGVVAAVTRGGDYTENNLTDLLGKIVGPPLLLILDGVQDPHNLGACLRTASAAGVHAVIAPKDKACGLTPVVYKVASGAAETIPFIQVTNLSRTMEMLKELNIWLYGAAEEAEQSIYDVDLLGPAALVLGGEGEGLRRLTQKNCDFLVKIPMTGAVPNLNVSVATGVCLFEAVRQRLKKI